MASSTFNNPNYPDCSEEEILDARKKCTVENAKNHMKITFRYYKIVVPYADGIKIMEALKNAEVISDEISWDYLKIIPTGGDNVIQTEVFSHKDYVELKMRHLLNIREKPKDSVF